MSTPTYNPDETKRLLAIVEREWPLIVETNLPQPQPDLIHQLAAQLAVCEKELQSAKQLAAIYESSLDRARRERETAEAERDRLAKENAEKSKRLTELGDF